MICGGREPLGSANGWISFTTCGAIENTEVWGAWKKRSSGVFEVVSPKGNEGEDKAETKILLNWLISEKAERRFRRILSIDPSWKRRMILVPKVIPLMGNRLFRR